MKNNITEAFKRKKIANFNEGQKEMFVKNVIENIQKDFDSNTDRYLFFVPDINVVNPLTKLIYDIAYELKESGLNAFLVHEKEGFTADWLITSVKKYADIPVLYTSVKLSEKSGRLKPNFTIKMSDSLFIPDVHLELIQDIKDIKEVQMVQKVMIVTGYSGLYTLNPGTPLSAIGINATLCFDSQVMDDYKMLFPDVKHYLIDSYKVEDYDSINLNDEEDLVKEPYILISGVGNNEKINQFVNIFYNSNPILKFIKIKLVSRKNYAGYLMNIKDAILFLDFDRMYVTNLNAQNSLNFKVPYISTNGFIEKSTTLDNNLITPIESLDMFKISEIVSNIIMKYLEVSDTKYKELLGQTSIGNKGIFEASIAENINLLRAEKINNFNKIKE